MATVTDAQVKGIIDTSRDTNPFIKTADLIVTEDLASSGMTKDRLDEITLYLAAHFTCITEESGGLRRSKLGDGDDSFWAPDNKEKGLAITRYGQQAMLLDKTGTLAAMATNAGLKARFSMIPVTNYLFGVATWDAGYIDPYHE